MTFISTPEELSNFDFKAEQIFRVENMLVGCKQVDNELCLVDTTGYSSPIAASEQSILQIALECDRKIEIIENPTLEQRLVFALNTNQVAQAESEGWVLFECDGEIQLQKDDEPNIFASDEDAYNFVKEKAANGSPLHLEVKRFLKLYSPNEYRNVFAENN